MKKSKIFILLSAFVNVTFLSLVNMSRRKLLTKPKYISSISGKVASDITRNSLNDIKILEGLGRAFVRTAPTISRDVWGYRESPFHGKRSPLKM